MKKKVEGQGGHHLVEDQGGRHLPAGESNVSSICGSLPPKWLSLGLDSHPPKLLLLGSESNLERK